MTLHARALRATAALVLSLAAVAAPRAGSATETGHGPGLPAGSRGSILDLSDERFPVTLGLGVSPLRWSLGPSTAGAPGAQASESVRLLDADARGAVVSFDLRLRWPGHDAPGPVEPYVTLGPALFVAEPDLAGRVHGTRVDPTLQLGAKAGAGVSWRLGRNTTLFGTYEITTPGPDGLTSPGARAPADAGVGGYDFTYGLRFRY